MEQKFTVLIVEDAPANRAILRKILSGEYLVQEAANGAEAWNILNEKENEIDAVLTDIVMPELDGYGLLAKIRQASMTELPVIVMTGEHDTAFEQRALDAGAWDFVSKPYNAMILRSRLRNAMARRQVSVYQQMRKMAAHDSLTGLHNRARTFEKAKKLIQDHPEMQFAFIRVDLDSFALYNTSFGEEEGDKLLYYLAELFRSIAEQFPLYAFGRVNADVFCACVPYSGHRERLTTMVEKAQRRLSEYRKNYLLELSVGVYIIDDPALSMEQCYVRASMGAQKCKRQYGVHIGYYDEAEGKRAAEELDITNEMETALAEHQFQIYLQPKVNLETDRVDGAEALVRWQHPEKGLVAPGLFIPVFERNGFVAKLDAYVWNATCMMLRRWLDAGYPVVPISANVSRISLYNPQLASELLALVEKYRLDVRLLQLEITESAYMTNPELMQQTIRRLRAAGFTLLMDDFGSGYSSLNTLKNIDVDILKIDMKFLPVGQDVKKAEIVLASVIKMANWLGMSVVVEGVETKEQRDFLEGTSCKYIQGYYFAKPMPQQVYEQEFILGEKVFEQEGPIRPAATAATILVIDDAEVDRQIINGFLGERFHVETCSSAEEGLLYLKRNRNLVRLILVDYMMPGMNGIDFLTYCQDDPLYQAIPQIMITANDSAEAQALAFQHGAYDYIAKPLFKEVILARVNHVMEVSRLYREVETQEYNYRSAAQRDPFTGLLNKNSFLELVGRRMEGDAGDSFALLVLDCDGFKAVNDRYGHMTGDAVLKRIALVLSREFRKSDLVGRFGGDEFMVLMGNLPDQEIVRRKAGDLIKSVAIQCAREENVNVGISVGVTFREGQDSVRSMFARADQALYEAKSTGKGKVVIYGERVPPIADNDKPVVLICGEDPQLYPTVALAYGDSAAFANITGLGELEEMFARYKHRIRVVCLDMQKRIAHDADAFYDFLRQQGCGTDIPVLAAYREGDLDHLRAALQLDIQDIFSLPPQVDVLQRKLSRAILTGCAQEGAFPPERNPNP